ncbi:MAG: rRNA maturation RNase YbeY, partial [Pseudomonadota bacterium]
DWRGQDKPTNVLAFAAGDARDCARHAVRRAFARRARDGRDTPRVAAEPLALGDVVVALETARAEATKERKPLADHLRHLVVHGMLHLLGLDHRGAREARRMERLETKVLATLDVPDPYAMPTTGGRARRRHAGRHASARQPPRPKTGRVIRRRVYVRRGLRARRRRSAR